MEENLSQTTAILGPQQPPKQERVLTAEEKEIATAIEKFKYLDARDKIFVLLVWRGMKTASPVSVFDASKETAEKMKELVKKAGLLCEPDLITIRHVLGLKPGMIYYVANNQTDLDFLKERWFGGDHEKDPEVYMRIGKMSGFPQTAIDIYNKVAPLPEPERLTQRQSLTLSETEKKDYLRDTKENKKRGFYPEMFEFSKWFLMSRNNWREEMKTVKKWADEIALVAPDLFKEFTKINATK